MVLRTSFLVLVSIAVFAGCDDQAGGSPVSPAGPTNAEDERGSVGPGSPAAIYCEKLGYKGEGESCIFPDGTSCEQWAFYRATCGQQHSYCNTHGGTVETEQADAGGFTTVTAICTVDGKRCTEENFYRTGTCDGQ